MKKTGFNAMEFSSVILCTISLAIVAGAIIDPSWSTTTYETGIINNATGTNLTLNEDVGLTELTYTYSNGTEYTQPLSGGQLMTGRVTAIGLLFGCALLLMGIYYLIRVSSGTISRDKGHFRFIGWAITAGVVWCASCYIFRTFSDGDFTEHPLHFGDGFMAVLISATLTLLGTIFIYFAYSREES